MTSHHLADATTWADRAAEELTAGNWEAGHAAATLATALAGIAHAAAAEDGLALVEASSCLSDTSFQLTGPGWTPEELARVVDESLRRVDLGRPQSLPGQMDRVRASDRLTPPSRAPRPGDAHPAPPAPPLPYPSGRNHA